MIIIAMLAIIGLVAGATWAGPWGGMRAGYHHGYEQGWQAGPSYTGNAGADRQAFLEETADLREELAGKRGEYNALMARDNPDPKQAATLQREIVQLREQIRAKAQAYNDSSEYGRYNGRGYGGGWGHHRGGRCW